MQFPQFNFVLGATHCEEAENLDGVLFSKIPSEGFANLFLTEISAVPPHIGFHRVSPAYRAVLNPIPPLSQDSAAHREDLKRIAAAFRQRLALHLLRPVTSIHSLLDTILPLCRNDYTLSARAGELLLAAYLLQSNPTDAARMMRPDYINLRGDSMLIAEALLYEFSIISEDADVRWMATRARIEVTTPATLVTAAVADVTGRVKYSHLGPG